MGNLDDVFKRWDDNTESRKVADQTPRFPLSRENGRRQQLSRASQSTSDMQVYIDLTDFVANTIWHNVCTGIQRVQLSLTFALVRDANATAFSVFEGEWHDLSSSVTLSNGDAERMMERVRQRFASLAKWKKRLEASQLTRIGFRLWRGLNRSTTGRRMRASLTQHLRPNDVLVVLGAVWAVPSLVSTYRAASQRGVVVVGLCHDMFAVLRRDRSVSGANTAPMQQFLAICDHLMTVSEYSKAEIGRAEKLGLVRLRCLPPTTIPLVQQFPDCERNARVPLSAALQSKLGDRPYVLFVSSFEAHKNHALAFATWRHLRAKLHSQLPTLVCAGRGGVEEEVLRQAGAIWIERPSDLELAELYSNCLFTLFPSREEGWGLPVGESLWFGKPCVAMRAASVPEVGGLLAQYFDAEDPMQLAAACLSMMEPATRAAAEARIRSAPLRSWVDVQAEFVAAVSAIAGSRNPVARDCIAR